MTLAEAEMILNEENTYWTFEDDRCFASYFTWMPDEKNRIGYVTQHCFGYEHLKSLDPEDWEDADRWNDITFGDAFNCPTVIDDIYTEDYLIYNAEVLMPMVKLDNRQAMHILKIILGGK